MNIERFVW